MIRLLARLNRTPAPEAQFNYGRLQETMGHLDPAKIQTEKAAKLDPKDPYPLFDLGDLARKNGDKQQWCYP